MRAEFNILRELLEHGTMHVAPSHNTRQINALRHLEEEEIVESVYSKEHGAYSVRLKQGAYVIDQAQSEPQVESRVR